MPPKDILTTPMANSAPISTIHQGVETGRFIASSRPVTVAAEGQNRPMSLKRNLAIAHSISTQETALTASTRREAQP